MIERVSWGSVAIETLNRYLISFNRGVKYEMIKELNTLLRSIGWVCTLHQTPLKLLSHQGIEKVDCALIFAPKAVLQKDLINTSKLNSTHGFYVCFNLDVGDFFITCGVQNLKEAQACPAFKKLFEGDKAKYRLKGYKGSYFHKSFLRLVALFNDLPLQDFKVGGVGSKQTFPRKADVYLLRGAQAHSKDYFEEALECYEKSAKMGDMEGYYEMGEIYARRMGNEYVRGFFSSYVRNGPYHTQALKYYEKSAKMGNAEAYNELGKIYWYAKGVPMDTEKTEEYFNKAIDMGSVEACLNMARMYREGFGFILESTGSLAFYRKAMQMGKTKLERANICLRIAKDCWEHCTKLHKHPHLAFYYLRKAVELAKGVVGVEACRRLASLGWDIYGEDYWRGDTLELYLRAIELGDTGLYGRVAKMYARGIGCKQDEKKALEYYQKAVEVRRGDEDYYKACCGLADMYFEGRGVDKDYAKALEYYKEIIEAWQQRSAQPEGNLRFSWKTYGKACHRLSQMYEKGLGVTPDLQKAFEHLKKACRKEDWEWEDMDYIAPSPY
ncbi:hypothetical protein NHP21005_10890 [Helicobacter sp. NHP21005]|uniref:tetratricopeptide repeat protein n=1 Tax=Helicobacter felistomachi TaxID=3040201 RepID=UPI0025732659|nr:tetratricopeptide repeat protein [Helicobacter sp. NHP21005]BEG57401.1 hypothetical protein NHP21005_10890 [Helicobacter sp. NHP21005]